MVKDGRKETLTVSGDYAGIRADVALSSLLSALTRAQIRRLIESGNVLVDGTRIKPARKFSGGEEVSVTIPPPEKIELEPEELGIPLIYEDAHIAVVDKPPGVSVHPGAGISSGTLVNALLALCSDLSGIGGKLRPGIVHRLDKDTSGVIVVAKNDAAHLCLANQFKSRTVEKRYLALVSGVVKSPSGRVNAPIGRHPVERKKFSSMSRAGREALTEWEVVERFEGATLLAVSPKTGRTHQIRVHMKESGFPIVGDKLYGPRKYPSPLVATAAKMLGRQALHASSLSFDHPCSGERVGFEAPLPSDMRSAIELLRHEGGG